MGMTSEEFWHGDLRLCAAYRKAHELKQEAKYQDEWRQGIYLLEALVAAAPSYRGKSKGEEHQYPQRPLFSTFDRDAQEKDEAKSRMERIKSSVETFAVAFNARFEQGE